MKVVFFFSFLWNAIEVIFYTVGTCFKIRQKDRNGLWCGFKNQICRQINYLRPLKSLIWLLSREKKKFLDFKPWCQDWKLIFTFYVIFHPIFLVKLNWILKIEMQQNWKYVDFSRYRDAKCKYVHIQNRDVTAGATGVTEVAPKFSDTLTLP